MYAATEREKLQLGIVEYNNIITMTSNLYK